MKETSSLPDVMRRGPYAYVIYTSEGPLYVGKGREDRVMHSMACRERVFSEEPLCAVGACIGHFERGEVSDYLALDMEATLYTHYKKYPLDNRASLTGTSLQQPKLWKDYWYYRPDVLKELLDKTDEYIAADMPRRVGTRHDPSNLNRQWYGRVWFPELQGNLHWIHHGKH